MTSPAACANPPTDPSPSAPRAPNRHPGRPPRMRSPAADPPPPSAHPPRPSRRLDKWGARARSFSRRPMRRTHPRPDRGDHGRRLRETRALTDGCRGGLLLAASGSTPPPRGVAGGLRPLPPQRRAAPSPVPVSEGSRWFWKEAAPGVYK